MFLLFEVCFIILFRENNALRETFNKKNVQFVEHLKQDLRRNNDDYAEFRRSISNNTQHSFADLNLDDVRYKIITTRDDKKVKKLDQTNHKSHTEASKVAHEDKEDVREKIIDNIRRRVNNALISKEIIERAIVTNDHRILSDNHTTRDNGRRTLRSPWNNMHHIIQNNNHKMNRYRLRLLSNTTNAHGLLPTLTLGTTESTKPKNNMKHVKKSKIDKFKKFINKNKGLLREFISGKKESTNISPATPAVQQTIRQIQLKVFDGRELNDVLRQSVTDRNHKKSLEELPNAAMLDMFPAKGGRIHSKRVKGHLCHRHVLIPEGPKYNSLGRIYLPPHAAANIAHEYNATDIPKLLLPRCCNCCRKSVLGCE